MRITKPTSYGFSLIELMIAMLIGLIVMAGLFSIFGQTLRNNRDIIGSARLNQDFGTIASIMANDIRRAGYSGGGLPVYGGGDPTLWYNARNADLTILPDTSGNPSCILYSYNLDLDSPDLNEDGTVDAADQAINNNYTDTEDPDGAIDTASADPDNPVIDPDEHFGFRFNIADGTISMRRSCDPFASGGDPADPDNDCYTSCTAGTWEEITDANVITIEELTFTTVGSRCMVDGTFDYWTNKATDASDEIYTDDPYTFPCDNHTTLVPSENLTALSEVDLMLFNGTTYAASTDSSAWTNLELLIPRTQSWATANPQSAATASTIWDSAVETRQINIHIRGRLTGDDTVTKETHTQVKVGNNRVFVAPTPGP